MEHFLNILLVDDEEIVHQTIASYLSDLGHRVDKVHDVPAALRSIEACDYDLALVDIRMPGMDGLSLLAKVHEIHPETSVVIITGHANMDMAIQSLKLGAADFLTKPIKLLELDAVLEKAVRLRKLVVQHMRDTEALREIHDELEVRANSESFRQTAEFAEIDEEPQAEMIKLKQAAEALRESVIYCPLSAGKLAGTIWTTDMNLRYIYVSPDVTSMLGYNVDEAMALTWEEILTPDSMESVREALAEELSTVEIEMIREDGSTVRMETRFTFLRDTDGRLAGILGILNDVLSAARQKNLEKER